MDYVQFVISKIVSTTFCGFYFLTEIWPKSC
nr:MAG TPA: hypothetical protein [Caudoviricetes sp.]